MPIIDVENLTDLEKAKMEVTQLKVEVKLEREKVSPEALFIYEQWILM